MKLSYIYLAKNILTGKVYIGYTSRELRYRMYHHKCASLTRNEDTKFYRSIRKHGWENFTWNIIYTSWDADYCLEVVEPLLIQQYNSINAGYNTVIGGNKGPRMVGELNGMFGKTHSDEVKEAQAIRAIRQFKDKSYEETYGVYKANELKAQRSETFKKGAKTRRLKDSTVYVFVKPDGNYLHGTKDDITSNFDLPCKYLTELVAGKRKTYLGWSVQI